MLSFASHSTRDSYIGSLPQWFEVRIGPNGAMCTGSCSSAKVIFPPFFGVAPIRLGSSGRLARDRAGRDGAGTDYTGLHEQVATTELASSGPGVRCRSV